MNINLTIIQQELAPANTVLQDHDGITVFSLESAQFYEPKEQTEPGVLYLLERDQIEIACKRCTTGTFLINGECLAQQLKASWNYLILPERTDSLHLMNRVTHIFRRFNAWESQLNRIMLQGRSLEELGSCSIAFFRNPLLLHDFSFKIAFHQFPESFEDSAELNRYKKIFAGTKGSYVALDEVNSILSDQTFLSHNADTAPYIYVDPGYEYRTLIQNIIYKGKTLAWILSDEVLSPFTEYDFAIISLFGIYAKRALITRNREDMNRPRDLDDVLDKLLRHILIPETKIASLLLSYHWKVNDTYLCMLIDSKYDVAEKSTLHAFIEQVVLPYSGHIHIFFEKQIVLIINLTSTNLSKDDVLKMTLPLLRDNLVNAGISDCFHDFKNLYYYYKQARYAYIKGQKKNPDFWYYYWEDYLLDHHMDACRKGNITESIIPAQLLELLKYDKDNDTEYCLLLENWLKNDCNIAVSSRQLYLARNTFLYRLDRIKKLLHMDLDSPQVRLLLLWSFELLK